ncbi:MAG TPA: alpha/beta fold hydrolase [Kofleriaceae bacterium]|nr:alpha/beta fold hydrolase [Kofleriaceae bacterium]
MATSILFVQGAGAGTHDDWDRKLVASLERALGADYRIRYPRMPDEAEPRYAAWKAALVDELASLEDGAIVVGHSVGGTVLLHALAEQPPTCRLGAIVSIAAPFIGDGGWPSDDIAPRRDLGAALPAGVPVLLYHGADDTSVPVGHVQLYARAIPQAVVRVLADRDHQLGNDLGEVARDLIQTSASTIRAT